MTIFTERIPKGRNEEGCVITLKHAFIIPAGLQAAYHSALSFV